MGLLRDKNIAAIAFSSLKEYYESISIFHIPSGAVNVRTRASLLYEKLRNLAEVAAMASVSVRDPDVSYDLAAFYYWLVGLAKLVESIAKKENITNEEVSIVEMIERDIKLLESLSSISLEDVITFIKDTWRSQIPQNFHEAIQVSLAAKILEKELRDPNELH